MQQRHLADLGGVGAREAHLLRHLEGQREHRLGVLGGVVLARVEGGDERLAGGRLELGAAAGRRLRRDAEAPARDARQGGEDLQVALAELRARRAAQAAQRAVQGAVGPAHRDARVNVTKRLGNTRANHAFFVLRKDPDDAVNGLGRVDGVKCRQHQVARLCGLQGNLNGFLVSHLTHQNYFRRLPQRRAQGDGKAGRV